jgi:D-alanine-D-alanine ligase
VSKMRVMVLLHKDLVPPDKKKGEFDRDQVDWLTEWDVATTLKKMGHDVLCLGVISDLSKIRGAITDFKPHIVYNLLEEFDGEAIFDQNVVSYLELMKIPYTGCNPRGLILARDKGLAKKILTYHRIKTAPFCSFSKSRKKAKLTKDLIYPVIVKCQNEEASLGLTKAALVNNEEKLLERVAFIHNEYKVDAIAEQFIEGREFYMGVIGNHRLKTFPAWELTFEKVESPEKEFYGQSAKWNMGYRKRKGIQTGRANLPSDVEKKMADICKRTYRALGLNGYARIDLRMDKEGQLFVIEANPNPDIAESDDFAKSAHFSKLSYKNLLKKILSLGLSWYSGE